MIQYRETTMPPGDSLPKSVVSRIVCTFATDKSEQAVFTQFVVYHPAGWGKPVWRRRFQAHLARI